MTEFKHNEINLGGLISNTSEDKIPERNASDILNIDLSVQGLIQTQRGYDILGNEITTAGNGNRGFLFKKNFGEKLRILMRVREDGSQGILEYYDDDNETWNLLKNSYTLAATMGFTHFNSTNVNKVVFCNGVEKAMTWNGAVVKLASVTSNTITKSGSDTFAFEGFSATGSVIIDGVVYAYTGGTDTDTLTGVTPDPTGAHTAGVSIAQVINESEFASDDPRGNILLTAAARLWMAGVTARPSTLYYSVVGDPADFSTGATPDDGGIEDFPDGGGAITLLDAKDNSKIIIHKEDAILVFELTYNATEKIPNLTILTLADDAGASNLRSGAGLNQVSYFTTQSEGLKSLARALEGDGLNLSSITDAILPSIANFDLSDAATIYYPAKRVIFIACKSSSDRTTNDRVISYYIIRNTSTGEFVGEFSIDENFVKDWILDGKKLYYISSVNQNVYEMFIRRSARGVGRQHRWVSKEFSFNRPAERKEFSKVYVEGLIAQGTKIKVTISYGPMGQDGSKSYILSWDDSNYVSPKKVSVLGSAPLGTLSIGAVSPDIQDSFPFSILMHFDVNLSSRYKISFETYYDDETVDESYWAISNMSTNVELKTINQSKVINTNI